MVRKPSRVETSGMIHARLCYLFVWSISQRSGHWRGEDATMWVHLLPLSLWNRISKSKHTHTRSEMWKNGILVINVLLTSNNKKIPLIYEYKKREKSWTWNRSMDVCVCVTGRKRCGESTIEFVPVIYLVVPEVIHHNRARGNEEKKTRYGRIKLWSRRTKSASRKK